MEYTAGLTLVLTCFAFKLDDLPDPNITWIGIPENSDPMVIISDAVSTGTTTTSQLTFDPLVVGHEGGYTCRAHIGTMEQNIEDFIYISVQSE